MSDGWIHGCGVKFSSMGEVTQDIFYLSLLGALMILAGTGSIGLAVKMLREDHHPHTAYLAAVLAIIAIAAFGTTYFIFAEVGCYLSI